MMRARALRAAGGLSLAAVVAVTGSRAGSVLAADKDVVVVNTPSQAMPTVVQGTVNVKDIDQPARAPFADLKSLSFDDGEAQKFIEFDPVPAGKRLVIETVTVRSQAAAGQVWDVHMFVTTNGVPVAHTLALTVFQTLGDIDIRSATLPVRLYADPGTVIKVFGHRNYGTTGIAGVDTTISGHYVNLP
jgi:hypothetical protein